MGKRSTAHTPGRSRRAKANQADAVGPAQPSLVPAVVAHLPSIIEHDGSFFWRATETDALVGPFKTMKAAIAN
ncbi:MAG: hypothetical protein H7125_18180, partial [Proteobacteria bacterium]|nr:hypothetical protein [Burkholderiales bacterium]